MLLGHRFMNGDFRYVEKCKLFTEVIQTIDFLDWENSISCHFELVRIQNIPYLAQEDITNVSLSSMSQWSAHPLDSKVKLRTRVGPTHLKLGLKNSKILRKGLNDFENVFLQLPI